PFAALPREDFRSLLPAGQHLRGKDFGSLSWRRQLTQVGHFLPLALRLSHSSLSRLRIRPSPSIVCPVSTSTQFLIPSTVPSTGSGIGQIREVSDAPTTE